MSNDIVQAIHDNMNWSTTTVTKSPSNVAHAYAFPVQKNACQYSLEISGLNFASEIIVIRKARASVLLHGVGVA